MNKILYTLALLCTLAQGAWAENFTVDGLKYTTDSDNPNNVSVTGAVEAMAGALTIPSTVTYAGKTYNVTNIEYGAFAWCENITSVTISEGVTTIENDAFMKCEKLESVSIPASVTSVGNSLFLQSDALTTITVADGNMVYDSREGCNAIIETNTKTLLRACKTTVIPSSVTTIGEYAFSSLGGLTDITIPGHVTTIDYGAFYGCKNLVSVTIGDGVTDIPWSCFSECKSLETITLGSGVQSIGNSAFNNCSKLETIHFAADSHLTFIDGYAFYNCGLKSVTLPNSVTTLGETIFSWCQQLEEVTLGNAITSIPFSSFSGCKALKRLYIPAGVVSMGDFYNSEMEDVYCSADPATMYWWSNDDDFAPGKVTRFHVFDKAAWEAKFPDANVTFVQDLVGGGSLTYSVNQGVAAVTGTVEENPIGVLMIPDTYTDANGTYPVKTIAANAFKDKTGLTAVSFPSVTVIGPSAFEGCTGLTTLTIPATVSSISTDAFKGCTGLRSLVVNANVGNGSTFAGCTNVAAVTFGQGVTTIGAQLFQGFTQLTAVTIPASVTQIGTEAFDGCSALSSVTFEGATPPATIGTSPFYGTASDLRIIVPAGSVDAYRTALNHYASRVECKSWSGNGSESTPYLISHKDELDLLAKRVNEGIHYDATWFKVTADIAYDPGNLYIDNDSDGTGDSNYVPIGGNYDSGFSRFYGHFQGNHHTVSGIRIRHKENEGDNLGLFGSLYSEAEISDLTLTDTDITGFVSIGGIAGDVWGGIISNCHVTNSVILRTISKYGGNIGGIVGNFHSTYDSPAIVQNCTSAVTVRTEHAQADNYSVGGIVGYNSGQISNSLAIAVTLPLVRDDGNGAITGYDYSFTGCLHNNYYTACTIAGKQNVTGVGVRDIYKGLTDLPVYVDNDNARILDDQGNPYLDSAVPALRDEADNTQAIALFASLPATLDLGFGTGRYPMQLAGRTLYKDGSWNTLCLPFDIAIEGSPLADATIKTLDNSSDSDTRFDASTGTLHLEFIDANKIEAGRPYIVKWTKPDGYVAYDGTNADECSDLVNPVFQSVTIENELPTDNSIVSQDGMVTFLGTYAPVRIASSGDNTKLYLGSNNTLYWPNDAMTIGCQRAYFQLNGITAGDPATSSAGVRAFVLDFGDGEEATGIDNLTVNSQLPTLNSDTWYTLDGRRLSGQPTTKGIYLRAGKKVMIQ